MSTITTVESIAELLAIQSPVDGQTVLVNSYQIGSGKGGGNFKYDSTKLNLNDGGLHFNGWIRLEATKHNVYDFGAYGDWNATAQTGHDDTVAFQKYASYLVNNENNPRAGGSRIMRVLVGNYRLKGFTISQGMAYWSFNLIGEGQLSQLWFDPAGQGIILQNENTEIKNIFFNGSLTAKYPDQNNPAIPYIIQAKLPNKYLDVDILCEGVNVYWFSCFARVSGRGFTFRNGSAGMGGERALLEIACDNDLIVAGDVQAMHSLESSMRNYKIINNRFDVCSLLVNITGEHKLKDYINGLTISDNEITLAGVLVKSNDCTLISPIYRNNISIASHRSSNFSGVFDIPRAKNVSDIGNSWNNIIAENNIANERSKGISFIHRYTDIDGLLILGTSSKDLIYGVVKTTGLTKNIKISSNSFVGFGDLQSNACILQSSAEVSNIEIINNTILSKKQLPKKYIDAPLIGNKSVFVKNNITDSAFPDERLSYNPNLLIDGSLSAGVNILNSVGYYEIDGKFINVYSSLLFSSTLNSGLISISLPITAVPENKFISNYISGHGVVNQIIGFNLNNNINVLVNANTEQRANLMLLNAPLNISGKIASNMLIIASFRYKYKD
ncbi:hypothetical protein ASC84_19100 [Acinetobacter sp. Root1280]|uniref:hypothetical protein n=1 Tax=Acinetobacter sp. Root1280 TaxID=1736444 RepID=UPI0006FA8D0E|nr:hypothetical protein [Acinetobacter sp. Root1280]KQX00137.1 hypothetical protein ASC84_19100 [Acinetobacter sp. Root1280]